MDLKPDISAINKAQNFPIDKVLSMLGIHLNKIGKFVCPFHQDPNPSMGVIKAKNRCSCFECGIEVSPVELVMKVLGYQDVKKALEFILSEPGPRTETVEQSEEKEKFFEEESSVSKTAEILTDFYWYFCIEVPKNIKKNLKNRFSPSLYHKDYMGWIEEDPDYILSSLIKQWDIDDLIQSGLVYFEKDEPQFALKDFRLVFPHFDYLLKNKRFNGEKIIRVLAAAKADQLENLCYCPSDKPDYPYGMEHIDKTKKILICEGPVNVLGVLSHNMIFSPIGLIQNVVPESVIFFLKGVDVTLALDHPQARNGESQRVLTANYHYANEKIVRFFQEQGQNIEILKVPIGVPLADFFRRYKKM